MHPSRGMTSAAGHVCRHPLGRTWPGFRTSPSLVHIDSHRWLYVAGSWCSFGACGIAPCLVPPPARLGTAAGGALAAGARAAGAALFGCCCAAARRRWRCAAAGRGVVWEAGWGSGRRERSAWRTRAGGRHSSRARIEHEPVRGMKGGGHGGAIWLPGHDVSHGSMDRETLKPALLQFLPSSVHGVRKSFRDAEARQGSTKRRPRRHSSAGCILPVPRCHAAMHAVMRACFRGGHA